MEAIKRLTADKAVVIFSKTTCCMSHTIKTLICSFGANPTVYELDELPDGQQLERALTEESGRRTSFPAVYVDQELVGGADEVMSLHVKGELVPLLKKARAIWPHKNFIISPSLLPGLAKGSIIQTQLSKEYHPDTTVLPIRTASDMFMRLREIYNVLSNEENRRFYDWTLAQEVASREAEKMRMKLEDPYMKEIKEYESVPDMVDRLGGRNMELSDQATQALTFDVLVVTFSICCIVYVVYFKEPY